MKRLADQTLYEILEVPQDAAPPAIEAAYDRARSLYGPESLATYTLISAEETALLTSRIEEAKRTLLDPDARARYDASLVPAEGEGRGAANGTNGTHAKPFAVLPPVIAALQPSAADDSPPPPPERPAPAVAPPRAAAAPIRLEREIVPLRPLPPAAPCPPLEIPIPDGAQWTGEALRRVREARGITIQQIAERTKVTRHHVENIEEDRFSALPAPVYLRGILVAIARELRLDGQKVARAYLERSGATPPAKPR